MKKTTRRTFVHTALKATVVTSLGTSFMINPACAAKPEKEAESPASVALEFSQLKLPYDYAALEPSIDAMTMDIHYNKHHGAYVKNVNEAIATEKISYSSEKGFFDNTSKLSVKARNNGGGAWNHNFFWQVMKPGAGTPSGKITEALNGAFGSMEKFKEQFALAAMTRFGSGWAWLVNDNGTLKIGSTPNQDNPLMDVSDFKGTPLLGLDVWEHAYYLKYQNKRNEYVANWWNVVNWEEVAKRLG
ncbi:MAG: superoxide dismutase [Cyclobacteriaceae bacterium]|nr:superoxide dismutase [Cyclobacteriaceae bacterium]